MNSKLNTVLLAVSCQGIECIIDIVHDIAEFIGVYIGTREYSRLPVFSNEIGEFLNRFQVQKYTVNRRSVRNTRLPYFHRSSRSPNESRRRDRIKGGSGFSSVISRKLLAEELLVFKVVFHA
ncbi:hypothetical protein [Mesotoga sp.]|uniref:hypothetical protein n=1 Tax=Mesotoga sp. TaxID=2053577 RepID=UPI00345EA3C7